MLRGDHDDAFEASAAVVWRPVLVDGLRFDLVADNLTNSDFQEFPGTPANRRQLSLRVSYSW